MPRAQRVPRIRAAARPPEEWTESQVETILAFGRREGEIIDQIVDATRCGDRNLCWQLAETLVRIEDEAKEAGKE
jgi:hypothetical protein